ncbi:MAG: bis(5'-nucleosyl)-tetraphosphatase (symmetrical) YqeK [Eubacteriales bacterium]|nr:bis(5'-nucleosyl)-tetraphosphatase (symmetrical) YqeK [Eubacteriales bacterium]
MIEILEYSEIRKRVEDILRFKPKRFEHTLGVMYTAGLLARVYNEDVEKCKIAGLLHDVAKAMKDEELIEYCNTHEIPLTPELIDNTQLLHSKVGASIAALEFGIIDEDILNAISYHTTGRPMMTTIEKIIYISDYIEPERNEASNLNEYRKLAFEDLDLCVFKVLMNTIEYLTSNNKMVDKDSIDAYNYFKAIV